MQRLKILLISDSLDNDSPSVYAVDVADELLRQGHDIRFVCPGAKCAFALDSLRKSTKDPQAPIEQHNLIELHGLNTPLVSFLRRIELKRSLGSFQPDIVHSLGEGIAGHALWLAKSLSVPCVVTCHRYLKSVPFGRDPMLSRVISVSDALREHLVNDIGLGKELVNVIPNGLNLRNYEPSYSTAATEKTVLVGTLGAMVERKGHAFLLKAAAKVMEQKRDAHFLIAGEGPLESKLRVLAGKLGITPFVTFSNYPFRAHSVIRELDIFVLPSISESLGFSALEALAYGKPVISFGIGGVYSFIKDGETGIIVPVRDIDRLSDAIVQLIDDSDRRERLGRQGRALVERSFSIDVTVARLTDLYREVLREAK